MGPEISYSKRMIAKQLGTIKADLGQEDSIVAGFTETLEGRSSCAPRFHPTTLKWIFKENMNGYLVSIKLVCIY